MTAHPIIRLEEELLALLSARRTLMSSGGQQAVAQNAREIAETHTALLLLRWRFNEKSRITFAYQAEVNRICEEVGLEQN